MHCSITIVWPWYWIVFCNLIQLFSTDAALLSKECQTKIHLLCHIVLSLTAATLIRRPIGTMAKRHNGMKADRMDNFFVGHPLGPEHSEFQIKCVIYKALSHLNLKDKWRFSSISETVILQAKQQAVKWNIKVQTKTIIVHRQLPEKFSVHYSTSNPNCFTFNMNWWPSLQSSWRFLHQNIDWKRRWFRLVWPLRAKNLFSHLYSLLEAATVWSLGMVTLSSRQHLWKLSSPRRMVWCLGGPPTSSQTPTTMTPVTSHKIKFKGTIGCLLHCSCRDGGRLQDWDA